MGKNNTTDMFADDFSSWDELVERLEKKTKVLKNPRIKKAFENVDRKDFVKKDYKVEAYEDYPLPQGYGSTISQPTTVAFMLELLDPQPGEKVLDVGAGSGYTTALLADMVGEDGFVLGVDIVPELVTFAKKNLSKYSFPWAQIRIAEKGVEEYAEAPFDKIQVSAAFEALPQKYIDQLKTDGVFVAPIGSTMFKVTKKPVRHAQGKKWVLEKESYPGFSFVEYKGSR